MRSLKWRKLVLKTVAIGDLALGRSNPPHMPRWDHPIANTPASAQSAVAQRRHP
jgi:hypothetical protein